MNKAFTLIFSLLLLLNLNGLAQLQLVSMSGYLPKTTPTGGATSITDMITAPDTSKNVFLVYQDGRLVRTNFNTQATKTILTIPNVRFSGEMGFLSAAFHPDLYNGSPYLFVHYNITQNNSTVIARYGLAGPNLDSVVMSTATTLLTFSHRFTNHKGGKILFGGDGMLYIAMGDGGSGNDPDNNAQNLGNFLGKILRIDINNPVSLNQQYSVPSDNPFVNTPNAMGEIWAYGLRNPWKLSYDAQSNTMITADVGQNAIEEVDIIRKGANYGWRIYEGTRCTSMGTSANLCNTPNLTGPVVTYAQTQGDRSITGGHVYRGSISHLRGRYIYGDYVSGKVWAMRFNAQTNTGTDSLLLNARGAISSFGIDKDGEVYVILYNIASRTRPDYGGQILKIVNPSVQDVKRLVASRPINASVYPNPAENVATLDLEDSPLGSYKIQIVGLDGRIASSFTHKHDGNNSSQYVVLDVHALPRGNAFISITGPAGQKIRKPLVLD